MLISVVIPAHNRPALLLEAIQSIAQQDYSHYEVVIIDDGSTPPISRVELEVALGRPVIFQRHDSPLGVPRAKNAGIKAAHGEVILLLDDDDLLTPDALACISRAYARHPEIDCLFLGVEPFGPYADGPSKNREAALTKIIKSAVPHEIDELYVFAGDLFDALLKTVPIDFQRPAARRAMWNIAGGFDESCLFSESAWAIRAACIGTIALTKAPVTRWRIHDNNFGWPPDLEPRQIRRRQIDNGVRAGGQLLAQFEGEERLWRARRKMIKKHQAEQLSSKAYLLRGISWREGMRALIQSFLLAPRPAHLKLAVAYLLPRVWFKTGA